MQRIIRRLGDEESKLKGVVEDYRRDSNKIIDNFEEARSEWFESFRAKATEGKAQMAKVLRRAEEDRKKESKRFQKETMELKKRIETSRKATEASIAHLLAMCEE